MSVVDEVIKQIEERGFGISDELLDQILRQAVICGEVTVKFNDDHTFEIVNPFKGCGCGE